ncbi:TMV resistance protein N-like protein [Tanacetum coccineum]
MASLHLESDIGEDAPQWIQDLRPSTSQLKIPVYPEVRDPRNPWAIREEMLLEDAIAANISRAEKKKKCRVVCRTHGVGSAHHATSDGVPVSAPTVIPQVTYVLHGSLSLCAQRLRSEVEFSQQIVKIIKEKLNFIQVYRQPNLVGMDTRDKEINAWLGNSDDGEILVIWGIDGGGKSTLAMHIVCSNWHKFESVSILEDIGSRSPEELRQLQEKLIRDITEGKEETTPSVCQGTYQIKKALKTNKAIVVLDNIETKEQLDKFLGTATQTDSETDTQIETKTKSKIIITTTEKNASTWFQSTSWRCKEHEIKLLDDVDSLKLLELHGFKPNAPMDGYEEFAKRALLCCQGNPLALKVWGSSLCCDNSYTSDRRKHYWESMMTSLERQVPFNIQEVLIKSYSSLQQEHVKELFLHIACFFNGKDKDYVEKILEPDYNAVSGIVTLINSCFLSVSPDNKLIMHRLLQDMGRTIVLAESPRLPGDRSRVWRDNESHEVLRKDTGSTKVLGLALDMDILRQQSEKGKKKLSNTVNTISFEKMKSLKLLQLNEFELEGSYMNIFKDLRWLCWQKFCLREIPPELDMENLVAIDMSCSKLEVFQPPAVLPLLKILNLTDSHDLREILNISRVHNLDTLILKNCCKLVCVCDTLRDLTSLATLDITGCDKLCKREQPNSFERIKAKVFGRKKTEQSSFLLPDSVKRLLLKDCNLESSDDFLHFRDQSLLEYLNLANNPFEILPNHTHLKQLLVLDLTGCEKLKMLICLPRNLAELYISNFEDLFKLVPVSKLKDTDLGNMKWLREYQDREVFLVGDGEVTKGRSLSPEMLYEFNIMSISLPDIEKPNRIPAYQYTSQYPELFFEVPNCSRTIKGLNLTLKYTMQGDDDWVWFIKIRTNNGVDLIYNAKVFGRPVSDEVGIWLSYWPIGNSLHDGDEVNVDIVVTKGLEIKECGASLVYADEEDENNSFDDSNESFVDANDFFEDKSDSFEDNSSFEDSSSFEDNNEHDDILGVDISEFRLSTGTYYLCRRDYSWLTEVGRLTPNWFTSLVGDTIDYTEIGGWRKMGRPNHGPQLDMDSDKNTVEPTPSIEKVEYSGSDFNGLEAQVDTRKGKKMEVENDSVKLRLDNELIKASHIQSMDAHKNSQPYITSNKKEGAGSSSSSSAAMEILIFAFNRLSEDDWYHDALFGETDIEKHLFPCLRRIGEDRLAKVNKIFLQRFQDILNNTGFKSEVEKAVMVDAKKVLFTGHSSGGAIASFATLWMLDEYTRKRGIKTPIGCLTFGSPLIGDDTLSHAVRREKWAGHFTHFVMEHDIVPRIMLAPKTSIQEHLPKILKIFQQNIKSTTRKPNITGIPFSKKTPDRTIDNDQLLKPDEAVSFFENILIHASKVASHDASVLMESTSSLMEKFSVDFVKLSPYRPFGHYVFCTCDNDQDPTETRQLLVVENPNAVLQLLFYFLQLPKDDQDLVEFSVNSFEESFSYGEELNKNGLQLQNMVYLKDLNKQLLGYDGTTDDVVHTSNKALFQLVN